MRKSNPETQRMIVHLTDWKPLHIFMMVKKKAPHRKCNPIHTVKATGLYTVRIGNLSSQTHCKGLICHLLTELLFVLYWKGLRCETFDGGKESSAAEKRPLLSTFTSQHVTVITVTVTGKGEWDGKIGDFNTISRDELSISEKVSITFISPSP